MIPMPSLHLLSTDDDVDLRVQGLNDGYAVLHIPAEESAEDFCIYGPPLQLLAFAQAVEAAVKSYLEAPALDDGVHTRGPLEPVSHED